MEFSEYFLCCEIMLKSGGTPMSFLSLPENELFCFCYQESCSSGSRLFLLRSNAFNSSCHLRCFGNRSALPPVHMERLLAKAAVWGSACVHHSCCLPVLHSNGSEPLLQSARLTISVWFCIAMSSVPLERKKENTSFKLLCRFWRVNC